MQRLRCASGNGQRLRVRFYNSATFADPPTFLHLSRTQVVAVGRICVPTIESGRYYAARGVTPYRDYPPSQPMQRDVDDDRAATRKLGRLRERGARQDSRNEIELLRLQLEQSARCERLRIMQEELCAIDLDAAPASSLARLYHLWGVEDEAAAQQQLISFAACHSLSAVQRSLALGMIDTTERIQFAQRCQLKDSKRAAAHAAAQEVLSNARAQ